MLEAGAKGYCSMETDPTLLAKAVKMVQKGEVSVGRKVISHLLDTLVTLTEQQRNRSLPRRTLLLITYAEGKGNCSTNRWRIQ